jgi:hypothetical protein
MKRLTDAHRSTAGTLLIGTTAVGILDGAFAVARVVAGGGSPLRPFQAVAAGLFGSAAFRGGGTTAALGVALHFVIAAGVVATYFVASRRVGTLTRHPMVCGALYGLAVYVIMYYVVIPLSALTPGPRSLSQAVPALLIHVLGVGIPAALTARFGKPIAIIPSTAGSR